MRSPDSQPTGHAPTLFACFLHFDVSFMLWVLLGALGVFVGESVGLGPAEKAFVVAVPILSGSLLRVPLGLLSDRFGAKRVGTAMLLALYVPLAGGWLMAPSLPAVLAIGLLLGVGGASFAVALPLASRWYPPERQGLAMGIAAAGNSGTVITNLAAPRLAAAFGWQSVLALSMIPLTIALAGFLLLARESPRGRAVSGRDYLATLRVGDMWWFCALYTVTFGGYVGLGSYLPILLRDQYAVSAVTAGSLTALVACVGSLLRPAGGYLADRIGGAPLLSVLLSLLALAYAAGALLPVLPVMVGVMVAIMALVGLGNGAVFQMVPQRFRQQIGLATGLVGAFGGVGGFLLPMVLGRAQATFGSFAPGFVALSVLAASAAVMLRALVALREGWRLSWRLAEPEAVSD